jgi:hypothetical protein
MMGWGRHSNAPSQGVTETGASINAPSRLPFLSLRSPGCRLRLLQSSFTIQGFGSEPAGWNVIPIEVLAGPIVRESNLEAAAPGDGFVL